MKRRYEQKCCKAEPEGHGVAVKAPAGEDEMPWGKHQYDKCGQCSFLIPYSANQQIEQQKRQRTQKSRYETQCKDS